MATDLDTLLNGSIATDLEPGEDIVAACQAQPRGWGQMQASGANFIARQIASRKVGKSRAAADEAGLAVDAPMLLVLTSQRLLTFKLTVDKMGRPKTVEQKLGAVPLGSVEALDVKRFGLGKRITVKINGRDAPLEGNRGASELADAFAGVTGP